MTIVFHDCQQTPSFFPLTLTKPISEIRTGIYTNVERAEILFPDAKVSFETLSYLQKKYEKSEEKSNLLFINSAVQLTEKVTELIKNLEIHQQLFINDIFVASKGQEFKSGEIINEKLSEDFIHFAKRWDLYLNNENSILQDFQIAKKNRLSEELSITNLLIGHPSQLFIEKGAKIEGAILNVNNGPIYIGENAEVMEGSMIRGPFTLGNHATIKMGAKIYGGTTIGPYCKVGGEVSNSVFQAYSNKGHDGFIGNALIGEWCNLGADTNTSNLKNNYGLVKTYDYSENEIVQTNQQFMGVAMGDHVKSAINTAFNTATVVGICSTVFGSGFPPKYIQNFAWGGFDATKYNFEKAIKDCNSMMIRRKKALSDIDIDILRYIYDLEKPVFD